MSAFITERIGDATLYLGDCRDVLPAITSGSIDAVVTDPPYGIGYEHGPGGLGIHRVRNLGPIYGDDKEFDPTTWLEMICVMFGGNHFYHRLPYGGTFHVWDKSCGVGPEDSFSDAEFIWTSWRCKSRIVRYLWKGILQDGEKGNPKYRAAQKPIAVMAWCIHLVPNANMILDPYMGSGSTGVACAKLGRKFIGIEIEPAYFDIACRRIEAAYTQPDMFVERERQTAEQPDMLAGNVVAGG